VKANNHFFHNLLGKGKLMPFLNQLLASFCY